MSKEWKSKLLSSSLPFEFDVAKLLIAKGFSVDSDFTYSRNDSGIVKDFSVDIEARAYCPFTNPNKISASLTLLIECKYRVPFVKWLFLPDPNKPDFSPITLGCTIRTVDNFSPYSINKKSSVDFDITLPICYKGTEIHLSNNSVYDTELKHGISQLQYALPRLFTQEILHNILCHQDDNKPFFFVPILITTAELWVTNKTFSVNEVEKASVLDDIAKKEPYIMLYSDYGTDFENHCSKECHPLLSLLDDNDNLNMLEDKLEKSLHEKYFFQKPSILIENLVEARRWQLHKYFTQFLICNYSELPNIIDRIKSSVSKMTKTRKIL